MDILTQLQERTKLQILALQAEFKQLVPAAEIAGRKERLPEEGEVVDILAAQLEMIHDLKQPGEDIFAANKRIRSVDPAEVRKQLLSIHKRRRKYERQFWTLYRLNRIIGYFRRR